MQCTEGSYFRSQGIRCHPKTGTPSYFSDDHPDFIAIGEDPIIVPDPERKALIIEHSWVKKFAELKLFEGSFSFVK